MIVQGGLLYETPVHVSGLLLIGDPHVSSVRPGRRREADWPAPVLAKLEACVVHANERDLLPVLLGDLFNEPVERDEGLKTRLIKILKAFKTVPLCNAGNHDMRHTRLSENDSLGMLATADVVDVVASSGPVLVVDVDGRRTGIGMTPFGQDIPKDVTGAFRDVDDVTWFTHHEIAFQETYPGAVPPFPVTGCGNMFNGHIHGNRTSVKVGDTVWHNPGSITRLSVDLQTHVPRAWSFRPGASRAEPLDLPHEEDVFDLTGRLVPADSPDQVARAAAAATETEFVTLLKAETSGEMTYSRDAGVVREEMEAKFEIDRTPPEVRAILLSLFAEATA